jgi:hypothetical protein
MGEVRLGEATTPLVDRVIGAIKTDGDGQELSHVISESWAGR